MRLPVWFYKKSVGRLFGRSSSDVAVEAAAEDLEIEIDRDENGASNGNADAKGANDALKSATAINANAETRKRKIRRAK